MATEVEISARIWLPAPAEQVWQAVTDWPRQREWVLATWGWRAVRPLAQRGLDASLRRLARTQQPAA